MRDVMRSRWAVLVAVLGLALAGCGDSNLFESQSDSSGTQSDLEAGLEALDNSDWPAAQRIFLSMDQSDPDVLKYLASAYVGEAGFDVLALVEQIDTGESVDGIYDMVTAIFDDGTGMLTVEEIAAKVDLVLEALTALGAYEPSVPRALRAAGAVSFDTIAVENQFQAGLYSALYVVLSVVEQLVDTETGEVLLTLAALESADACLIIGGVVVPEGFDGLLQLVREAVQVIVPDYMGGEFDNDIARELDQFLTDIGYLVESSEDEGENVVTDNELRSYLRGLLNLTCDPPA